MGKTILVVSREGRLGDEIAGHFLGQGCRVAVTLSPDSSPQNGPQPQQIQLPWNPASAVSTKNVLLRVFQEWGPLDEVWIVVHPDREAGSLANSTVASLELMVDRRIKGLLFFVRELTQRQKQSPAIHFVFYEDDPATLPPLAALEYFGLKALVRGLLAESRDEKTVLWAYEAQTARFDDFVSYILTSKSLHPGAWNALRDKKGLGWFGKKEAP